MKFNDFYVTIITNKETNKSYRQIIYTDDINKTIELEYANKDVNILDKNDYTIDDYCTIVESLLEDVNAHKYCNKIYDIIEIMRSVLITEDAILDFVREYTYHMFELYGN